MEEVKRGNDLRAFKRDSAEEKTEPQRVAAWRSRLRRAHEMLELEARVKDALRGEEYLTGKVEVKNGRQLYLRYLPPVLEGLHRNTLPNIPIPRVEARNEQGELYEEQVRQFLTLKFEMSRFHDRRMLDRIQMDDDRFGCFVAKVEWRVDYDEAAPDQRDMEVLAMEIDHARDENANILMAKIADTDIDYVHLEEHISMLGVVEPGPESEALDAHIAEHEARLSVVRREDAILARVPVDQYLHDPDVPWEDRAWEAELESVKIADMIDMGWKNVNEQNVRPEEIRVGFNLPFEDATARVWKIHDRRNKKYYVISVDGPEEGFFLHQGDWPYRFRNSSADIYYLGMFRELSPSRFWGTPTVQICLPILDELARVDFHVRRHVETHSDYKMLLPDNVEDGKIKAGLNDPNQRYVKLPKEVFAGGGLKEYTPPPIPQTLLDYREVLLNELRRATALDAQDVGASNPHAVSATESSVRNQSTLGRKMDRQDTMAMLLSWIAETKMKLYHELSTMTVAVRIQGQMGTMFDTIDPATLPIDYDYILDVKSETDEARLNETINAEKAVQFLMSAPIPVDYLKLAEWYCRKLGVRRPEQFRAEGPMGPQNVMPNLPGQPGIPGGPQRGGGETEADYERRGVAIPFPGPQTFEPSPEALGTA